MTTAGSASQGRPALGSGAVERDVEVSAGRELVEVVAGDVRVERELPGDLAGGHAVHLPAEEVDVTAGRVAEGAGDGGDRGGERVVVAVPVREGRRHVADLLDGRRLALDVDAAGARDGAERTLGIVPAARRDSRRPRLPAGAANRDG